jgi:hypothetical protein
LRHRTRTGGIALGVLAVALTGAVLVSVARPFSSDAAETARPHSSLRSAWADSTSRSRVPRPAFQVPDPKPLDDAHTSLWAAVALPADAHLAPGRASRVVARLEGRTPEGTKNIVLVLGRAEKAGGVWVHVRLPVLPNGTTGWVPREALGGYVSVRTRRSGRLRSEASTSATG